MKKFIALLLSVLLCFSLCACGGKSEDTQTTEPSTEATTEETTEDINTLNEAELFSAKFCMVYMKHLKNPYSFTVRSICCYKQVEGQYKIFVKYTAENGYGGTVADQIGTMSYMDDEELNKLSSDSSYLSIYTTDMEPSYNKGDQLDANKIQNYINNNF